MASRSTTHYAEMPAELRLMWVFGVVWSSKVLDDDTGSGNVGLPSPRCDD